MRTRYLIIVALLLGSGCQAENALADRDVVCHLGAYQLADGEVIDINPTSTQGTLRWHRVDGRTGTLRQEGNVWRGRVGWTQRDDPTEVRLGTCGTGRIFFDGKAGNKVSFAVTDTRFRGAAGVQLRGRLVMPEGDGAVPVVVLVHGSEEYSGVDYYHAQHLFPAHGIGVFVYDKRGTGQSGGRYTQDFDVLANDAVAALEVLERDPEIDVLFSDVVMPKNISGIDLARQAMALRPGIRVLLASGYSIDQLPSFPPGCAFIPKPYRFEDLQARLESMGED